MRRIYRDREVYGVANVYHGGSDFEVVEEDCFLSSAKREKFWCRNIPMAGTIKSKNFWVIGYNSLS